MKKNKIFLSVVLICGILLSASAFIRTASAVQLGEQKIVDIIWSRTTEPDGYRSLPVAGWFWSDVNIINNSRTTDVWDGGTIGSGYIGTARRLWDIATWHTNRHSWNGTADVRRFHGQFTIPDGYSTSDDIMISSVGDYSSLGLDEIIAINDNLYVFVYPAGVEINDSNFMDFFAFWTGTASQEAVKAVNGGELITFHGEYGTTPYDYKTVTGSPIPQDNLLSHTDGWYCEAAQDNIGFIIEKYPDSTEFILDVFVEDFAEDGGMDRLEITFTKTTADESTITEQETETQTVTETDIATETETITEIEIVTETETIAEITIETVEIGTEATETYVDVETISETTEDTQTSITTENETGDTIPETTETEPEDIAPEPEITPNPPTGILSMTPFFYAIGIIIVCICIVIVKERKRL